MLLSSAATGADHRDAASSVAKSVAHSSAATVGERVRALERTRADDRSEKNRTLVPPEQPSEAAPLRRVLRPIVPLGSEMRTSGSAGRDYRAWLRGSRAVGAKTAACRKGGNRAAQCQAAVSQPASIRCSSASQFAGYPFMRYTVRRSN